MIIFHGSTLSTPRLNTAHSGQSLVELALTFPILLLILVGGAHFGFGLYQANLASSAIQQPALHKLEMADTPGAISPGTVLNWVTGNDGTKGSMKTGDAVDSVKFVNQNAETAIIVGTKRYKGIAPFLPSFDITVVQGINSNLLQASGGSAARVRPANGTWVPGGAPRTPPWMDPLVQNAPPDFRMNPSCAASPVGIELVNALNSELKTEKTYISNKPVAFFSPVEPKTLIQISQEFEGACASAGAAICAKEYEDLLPDPPKDQPAALKSKSATPPDTVTYVYETKNPPGGPGTIVRYTFECSKAYFEQHGNYCDSPRPAIGETVSNPDIGPDHGMYFDPTGKYEKPPDDFKDSCMSRKQAECMLEKGVAKANQIAAKYPDICR
ncbi:MAG TPA: TadE family protein [Oculatellaceae cyanobacterium]